ncbi:hypothetical protein R1flu_026212 [Riccia fluitans]|uniref:Uncharacterized protein n=1 Tax=Riccia fluitans TaxID=41844 RepID=A0ABD1XFB5_9MARC
MRSNMDMHEFLVHLRGNKSRDDREVQEFAKLLDLSIGEVKGVAVKSLTLSINSVASVEAYRTLLELPFLSPVLFTIIQDFSLGAVCLDTLADALEAGHIRSLEKLDLRYSRKDSRVPEGGVLSSSRMPEDGVHHLQASLSNSQRLSSSIHGDVHSQSLPSTSNEPPDREPSPPVSWKGFASLGAALRSGWLPNLEILELDASFDSVGFGDEGAEGAIVEVYTRNTALIATVDIDWGERALEARWKLALQRNVKLTGLLKTLSSAEAPDVPVTNAKIFICGFPGVGKTTLRESLKRSRWTALVTNELKPCQRRPTRAPSCQTWESARDELLYWLRFIASNSIAGVKRKVVVVLNTIGGAPYHEKPQWDELVRNLHGTFEDILELRIEPVVLDARQLKSVKRLRKLLFEQTGAVLQQLRWPKICQYIRNNLQSWVKENQNFPVIHWNDFVGKLAASGLAPEKLEAAAEYLHETGQLIYFRKGSLGEGGSPETRLIVLDRHWFCRRIVGELLLPYHMVCEGERYLKKSVAPDGTLELQEITVYFNDLLKNSPQVNYVVGMLIRLGLCYKRVADNKVLILALVEQDNLPDELWGTSTSGHFMGQWVMGRSLALTDTERNALPISLFRRLQVQLVQDPELGGYRNTEYAVGKSFLTFKRSGMVVLVQCDVDDNDPRDDRLDIIAKPSLGRDSRPQQIEQRKKQIELVEVVMERLSDLSFQWCPGVKFVQKVILPWNESSGVKPMLDRNTEYLDEVLTIVQRNGLGGETGNSDLNWVVDDEEVRVDELLSSNDLDELHKKMTAELEANIEKLPQLVKDLGLCTRRSRYRRRILRAGENLKTSTRLQRKSLPQESFVYYKN